MALLEAKGITVRFGGNLALDGVDFEADAARITGLIGPNGAGKTTLFNVMTGLLRPYAGQVLLDGQDVSRLNPTRRARRGIGRTFQRLELFGHLSVRDNVRVAADFRRGWSRDGRDPAAATEEIIERLALGAVADARVGDLPTGLCRQVELGRAMAIRPRVLLLDEPASGQDEQETEQLASTLLTLAAEGLAIVLVEHDLHLVMRICDPLYVLDLGKVIAVGPPQEIQEHPGVLAAYVGGPV
jgi:branched-chain amino acid transport system ATP-binding protein